MLFSKEFDDVYFSREDGLAESRFVFLENNNLPQAWRGKDSFTILELGFGSGLNFLAALKAWEETATPDQKLHFISVEKFPLSQQEIAAGLAHWSHDIALDKLLAVYPAQPAGVLDVKVLPPVRLTVYFTDIESAVPQVAPQVDAIFLDGFAPAKNPVMWSDNVLDELARVSDIGTSFATFTAAGFVKRGLAQRGFAVEKVRGYGRKRDMLRGCFIGAAAAQ